MFPFRVLWIPLGTGCVGCFEVVIVYGVGGLDDVAFVGDVYGLAFCGWKCSQCDSHLLEGT